MNEAWNDERRPLGVVTGASRGFGMEVTRALSASGWEVITISRHHSDELAQMPSVTQVGGDVARSDLSDLLGAVGDRPLDLLVNNAGVGGQGLRLDAVALDELESAFSVNVLAPTRVAAALLPALARGEHALIVNISSRLASLTRQASGAYRELPTSYAYRISKAAQNMLTICMAAELGPSIRMWAVHPGRLRTALGPPDADVEPAEAAWRLVTLMQRDKETQLAYISLDEGPLPW